VFSFNKYYLECPLHTNRRTSEEKEKERKKKREERERESGDERKRERETERKRKRNCSSVTWSSAKYAA